MSTTKSVNVSYDRIAVDSITEKDKGAGVSVASGILNFEDDMYVYTKAGTPTDGTSGTGAGVGGPGTLCIDYTNKLLYMNEGTKASPSWGLVSAQSA